MKSVTHNQLTWINFEDPSPDDILYLKEHFKIHPLAIEEFTTPTYQPKAVFYDNCVYLVVHIPLFDAKERTTYSGELDILITHDHLITSHWQKIHQLDHFFRDLQKREDKRHLYMENGHSPASLCHHILEMLLNTCFPRLEHIAKNLDHIEEQVFNGYEKEMVFEISVVKRDILNFRRAVKPERSILESLAQKDSPFIPRELKMYFQDLIGTNIRLWNILENNKEIIESLEETNNSLLSNKLDQTMKVLTIFSAIILPLTVYSNILAMSASIPFGHSPYAFWIHVSIMLLIAILTITLFRWKKWF